MEKRSVNPTICKKNRISSKNSTYHRCLTVLLVGCPNTPSLFSVRNGWTVSKVSSVPWRIATWTFIDLPFKCLSHCVGAEMFHFQMVFLLGFFQQYVNALRWGQTAQEYIKLHTLNAIKERLADLGKSVTQISYELGFQYPQHLSRFFKKETGMTPAEFRMRIA